MNLPQILEKIDKLNALDPNKEVYEGKEYPKEVLYSERMTEMLWEYISMPSEALQVAARGQHIQRWSIPRSDYPMDRPGYLKWRTQLKMMHGRILATLLTEEGCNDDFITEVVDLVTKKRLKNDPQTQQLEDVICLVFLKYYFKEFAAKNTDEKLIQIVQKTWGKMTPKGHEAALKLPLEDNELRLVKAALA
jgi:hypothetical protein